MAAIETPTPRINPLIKLALDFGPLLIFFAVTRTAGIYWGTGVFMGAMVIAITVGYVVERKLEPMPLFTLALVLVLGALTIWLSNDLFIKIKPTILYTMFAAILLGGLRFGRLYIKILLGQTLRLNDAAWRTLTWRWSVFFLVLAVLNEIVWRNVSTNTWVAFKVFGVFPLTLLFGLLQAPFILRHQIEDKPTDAG